MNTTLPHRPRFFKQRTELEAHTEPEDVTVTSLPFTQVTSEKRI